MHEAIGPLLHVHGFQPRELGLHLGGDSILFTIEPLDLGLAAIGHL